MQNIAIIKHGTGRYLFSVPENVTLREGDRVKCDTRRGITDGIAFADSAWVDENISQLIGKLTGAKFPLKSVVGRLEYLPFEKPQAANPANKYEGMSNTQLKMNMCTRGSCHVCNDGRRKLDCLFADDFDCDDVTDANRAEVIRYLLEEDAASEKPEEKPTVDKPKFKVGDKVKFIFTGYSFDGEIGTVQRVGTGNVRVSVDSKYPDTHEYFCLNTEIEPYAPSFDWDAFKAGKIAVHCDTEEKAKEFVQKCRENLPSCATDAWEDGETNWYAYSKNTCYVSYISDGMLCYGFKDYYRKKSLAIIDYPFSEQPAEPTEQKEPIKLYCAKDYITPHGNVELIKGAVFTFNPAVGALELPDGSRVGSAGEPRSYDDWKTENPCRADCLVPLVKRPAKVGEYVLLDNDDCFYINKRGDVVEVVKAYGSNYFIKDPMGRLPSGICTFFGSNYSYVLDGYHAEPEAEPEPEYFSGKVVCVSSGYACFTVGKMYEFINGEVKDDDGDERPMHADERFKSVDEWNSEYGMPIARFIEFKGEAHD